MKEIIKFIPWWHHKTYKNGVSLTDWISVSNELKLVCWAIVLFDQYKYPELFKANKENCCIAVKGELVLTGTKKDKVFAREIEKDIYKKALECKQTLQRTGRWGIRLPPKTKSKFGQVITIHHPTTQ